MCKRWLDVAQLSWQTRKCIRFSVRYLPSDQMLNTLITSKHIGHALARLELYVSIRVDEHLAFTALAKH